MKTRELVAQRFAENLARQRRRAGLSQEALAARAGLHRTEISLLETRRRVPGLETLVKLCDGLGVSPDELLDGINWQTGEQGTGGGEMKVRGAQR